jgi:SAM-dependent methyltransferase
MSNFLTGYYRMPIELDGEYRVERCGDCRTMFQGEVGDNDLLGALYGTWIKSNRPEQDPAYCYDVANPRRSRDGHEIMAAAAHLGLPLDQLVTLDFGMGWASWARISAALGCQAYGHDLSEERRAHAERHGVRTDVDGRQYHFINTEQVMEHVSDPGAVVAQLAGMLRPGGILKISVPSNRGAAATLERLKWGQPTVTHGEIMPILPLEHVTCFTAAGLEQLGQRFGLRPVRPAYRHRYAFLAERGTLDFRDLRRMAKELIRPWYQFHNPRNLYVWLRKA